MEKEKLEKIKNIKRLKVKKRIIYSIIVVCSLILICAILYLGDKNAQIFGGNIAGMVETKIDANRNKKENKEEAKDGKDEKDEKSENKAANVAIKKFKELGENTKKSDLEILKIERKGELYYYISSKENTVEVRIKDNKITRVNSVPVE